MHLLSIYVIADHHYPIVLYEIGNIIVRIGNTGLILLRGVI